MGLDITIGVLLGESQSVGDEEYYAKVRADLEYINGLLRERGLPAHREPTSFGTRNERWTSGMRYSTVHYLRRCYSYAKAFPDQSPPPFKDTSGEQDREILGRVASASEHFLSHSDMEGYYIPVDFPEVICDQGVYGTYVGSTQRLLAEMVYVAPYLGIELHGQVLRKAEYEKMLKRHEAIWNELQKRQDFSDDSWAPFYELEAWNVLYHAASWSIKKRAVIMFC